MHARNLNDVYSLIRSRYFRVDAGSPDPIKWQLGTVRTNCMDNLDRTNVGQAAIAKWTLNLQLKTVGILLENDSVDNHEELNTHLRESKLIDWFPS